MGCSVGCSVGNSMGNSMDGGKATRQDSPSRFIGKSKRSP